MILIISRFGFEGWIWVPIASVSDPCILFTFTTVSVFIIISNVLNISDLTRKCHYSKHFAYYVFGEFEHQRSIRRVVFVFADTLFCSY